MAGLPGKREGIQGNPGLKPYLLLAKKHGYGGGPSSLATCTLHTGERYY